MDGLQKIIRFFCYRNRRQILEKFEHYKQHQKLSRMELDDRLLKRLNALLNHAFDNVPYYKEILMDYVQFKRGRVCLKDFDDFTRVPPLTRQMISEQGSKLHARDHAQRKSYMNSSGGSTGEPVRILQDQDYLISEGATFLLPRSWKGVGPYDSEIYIWGSERDTFKGRKPLRNHIRDFLSNRIVINSFNMSPADMERYIRILNNHRPRMIRAYADGIYEIAAYADRKAIEVRPQRAIHCAAGTLHDYMRATIEKVFACPVFNHYGCREVGSIASECEAHDGMHLLMDHNFIEIVDHEGNPCDPGTEGEILVTNLDNHSMPIVRYRIGDLGVMKSERNCECGCSYPRLQSVSGRTSEVLRTTDGRVISPVYFAHLIGVVHRSAGIKRFQVVQKDYDKVVIKMVREGETSDRHLDQIKEQVRLVMGDDCRVDYDFVDKIAETRTGKFLHMVSELKS